MKNTPIVFEAQTQLLDQIRHKIRLKDHKAYVVWIRRFILFHNKKQPLSMGAREIEQFLNQLAVEENVAASTQNQGLGTIAFLYRQVLNKNIGSLDYLVMAKRPALATNNPGRTE